MYNAMMLPLPNLDVLLFRLTAIVIFFLFLLYSGESSSRFLKKHLYHQVEEQSDLCDVTVQAGTWVSIYHASIQNIIVSLRFVLKRRYHFGFQAPCRPILQSCTNVQRSRTSVSDKL